VLDTSGQEAVDVQGVSRRDFLKLCSLMIGGLGLPRDFVSSIERAAAAPASSSFTPQVYFQWHN